MSFSKRFNKARLFDIDTTGFKYNSMHDLYTQNGESKVYPLKGIYINTRGKYDDSPVFATDEFFVNVPSHMTSTAKDILADDEAVKDINNGKVGFKIYTYVSNKYNKQCYNVEFVDV